MDEGNTVFLLDRSAVRAIAILLLLVVLSVGTLHAQVSRGPEIGRVERAVDLTYYDVVGNTTQALAASLHKRSPLERGRRFYGLTEWEVNTEYRWVERPTGCSMEDVVVRIAVQTRLPRWRDRGRADLSTRRAWDQFVYNLGVHEAQHRTQIADAAEAMRWRLVSLREPTCRTMKRAAQRALEAEIDACKASNDRYDRTTGHGRTQGASWPPEVLGTR